MKRLFCFLFVILTFHVDATVHSIGYPYGIVDKTGEYHCNIERISSYNDDLFNIVNNKFMISGNGNNVKLFFVKQNYIVDINKLYTLNNLIPLMTDFAIIRSAVISNVSILKKSQTDCIVKGCYFDSSDDGEFYLYVMHGYAMFIQFRNAAAVRGSYIDPDGDLVERSLRKPICLIQALYQP